MKLKRKKVADRTYELIDTEVGDVVARVSMTGRYGVDDYPWDWSLTDETVEFGDSGFKTSGVTDTLSAAIDFIETNANRFGLTYRRSMRDRDQKRAEALAAAKKEDQEKAAASVSALKKMVRKLDARNKYRSAGYVTGRDELINILKEVSPLVSVSIIEKELPYAVAHTDIAIEIKLSLTLERDKL
jgi:hypothetical protein